MFITRRGFLLAAAGLVGARITRKAPSPPDALHVGFVSPGDAAASALGARLGGEEAAHAAALVGGTVDVTIASAPEPLLDAGVQVLIGGADDAAAERLSALAEQAGVLFLNVGATADALRTERCRPHTFHVAASAAMRRAARASAEAAEDEVRLWHESLTQYGAAQLNDRFRARFGAPMTDDAWATWLAVKIAAETALRTRHAAPADLVAYLARPGVRFDGHKGRALAFGADDHQLRQPLYRVHADPSGATVVEELHVPEPPTATPAGCGAARP